jgi:hypothetical protein
MNPCAFLLGIVEAVAWGFVIIAPFWLVAGPARRTWGSRCPS